MENNIKLSITSPVGATLNTSGKYCDGDIEVIPYLQEKTVTESGEVLPDEGYAGLSKVMVDVQNSGVDTSKDTITAETMLQGVTAHNASGEPITGTIPTYDGAMQEGLESYPKFQEKTATENGEVLPDEGFDGLSKVTVNVPSTGGGSANKTIVVNNFNVGEFPSFVDGLFIQISSDEFTLQELENTFLYCHPTDAPIYVYAPQSYLEGIYGESSAEREDCHITTFEWKEDDAAYVGCDGVLTYVTEDIDDGTFIVTKGLYINGLLAEFMGFTLIINY